LLGSLLGHLYIHPINILSLDSLPNKCDELKARVQNAAEKYDIIGVTKVYPKNCRYSPGKAELLGYELYFNESGENKRGTILEMMSLLFFYIHLRHSPFPGWSFYEVLEKMYR
jgi:hypothetical protein